KSVTCGDGSASCYVARLKSPLDTEYRSFHPETLRYATKQINEILEGLRRDGDAQNGKHLAFISVPGGMMLNWVSSGELPRNAITLGKSTEEQRLRAYGLIPSEEQAAQEQVV